MQISGYLPSSALPANRQSADNDRDSRAQKFPDSQNKSHRQTVEYLFHGEMLDDATANGSSSHGYSQMIDPANKNAISSYTRQQSGEVQQGRLLDIFI